MSEKEAKVNVLLKKSIENYRCAELAHKEKHYNAAISRLYYACLLLAKCCGYKVDWLSDSDFTRNKATHKTVVEKVVNRQLAIPSTSYTNTTRLSYFMPLKTAREAAEYASDIDYCTPNESEAYRNCKANAKNFIEALEEIYNIKVI